MSLRLLAAAALFAASTPALAEWQQAKSNHFLIYADAPTDVLRDYASRLERFDQAVRKLRGMNDPALRDSGKVRIYVVGDFDAIENLIGIGGAAGLYIGRASGAVAFVPELSAKRGKPGELDSQTVFFHEYTHHLQLESTPAALPPWIVEGTAEFFSTADIKDDGSVAIGAPANHRAVGLYLLAPIPIEKLVGDSYTSLTDYSRETLYGRGWLLTHYLTFERGREGQLDRYVQLIQQGQPPIDAARAAFGDLKQLGRDLDDYMKRKRLTQITVPASMLNVGTVTIRPLRPGEAAVMTTRIRSERGVSKRSAPAVAADARKIAAAYPEDPAVQTEVAEAEFDAGNFDAAEAAANRALAIDPNSRNGLIYKGLAQMERAKKVGGKADWEAIRSLFISANRLDPDDPEPPMHYFETFIAAGEKPTENAVKGLVYAAQLMPQDSKLRRMATRQLIEMGNFALAKQMFSIFAYNAHAKAEVRDKNRRIMEDIDTRNAAEALSLLEDKKDASDDDS